MSSLLMKAMLLSIAALSLHFLIAYVGLVSFGHVAELAREPNAIDRFLHL